MIATTPDERVLAPSAPSSGESAAELETCTVRVWSCGMEPVAGCTIRTVDPRTGASLFESVTDGDGRCAVPRRPLREVDLVVEREGFVPHESGVDLDSGPLDVFLFDAVPAAVYVIDAVTRAPIPTARVSVVDAREMAVRTGLLAAGGVANLVAPCSVARIEVTAEGYLPGRVPGFEACGRPGPIVREVFLQPGGHVLFRVTDESGADLSNPRFETLPPSPRVLPSTPVATGDGRFHRVSPDGHTSLQVSAEGHAATLVRLTGTDRRGAVGRAEHVILQPGCMVTGRPIGGSPDATPVGFATPWREGGESFPGTMIRGDARADGTLTWTGLERGGTYRFRISKQGALPFERIFALPDAPSHDLGDIRLDDPVPTLRGTVLDSNDEPLSLAAAAYAAHPDVIAHSDRLGHIELPFLELAWDLIRVSRPGRCDAWVDASEARDQGGFVVRLEAPAAIRGRVVDSSGAPIAGAVVRATSERFDDDEDDHDRPAEAASGISQHDGTFVIEGCPRVPHGLRAFAPGYTGLRWPAGVEPGADTDVEIRLSRLGYLRISTDALPVEARLTVHGEGFHPRTTRIGPRSVNERALPTGRYVVLVAADGFAPRTLECTVQPGEWTILEPELDVGRAVRFRCPSCPEDARVELRVRSAAQPDVVVASGEFRAGDGMEVRLADGTYEVLAKLGERSARTEILVAGDGAFDLRP